MLLRCITWGRLNGKEQRTYHHLIEWLLDRKFSYTLETLVYHWKKCVVTLTVVLQKYNCSEKNVIVRYNVVIKFTTDFTGFLQ